MSADLEGSAPAPAPLQHLRDFRALFASHPMPMLVCDLATLEILAVNEAMVDAYGYTHDEFVGMPMTKLYLDEDMPAFLEVIRLPKTPLGGTGIWRHRRKHGSLVLIETSGNAISFQGRNAKLVLISDVTEREKLKRAHADSEERFRQIAENIYEVFWMVDDSTGELLYVSPGYEKIWGRSCSSLYAAPFSWSESIHPHDRERVVGAFAKRRAPGAYDEVYRIVRPDGSLRWIRDRAFPVKSGGATSQRIVGLAEDITEFRNLNEKFLRAQRLESVGMLSLGVAHDLNNVLAPIGMAATLLRANVTNPRDCRMLDTLETCVSRGAHLLKHIMGFVHGAGEAPRIVQVKPILHDIVGVISETFPKSISLQTEVPNDLWPVFADPTHVHQLLLNLCVNARDAMPQGGLLQVRAANVQLDEAAASRLEGGRAGAWLVLQVTDSGMGIPPDVVPRIWEPFFTTKIEGKGTGLGLSTVRSIVETQRGFITLSTAPGTGTSFRVFLPAMLAGVQPADAARPATPTRRGANQLILLVDDEKIIRETASVVLRGAGYRVLAARDGAEALDLFEKREAEIAAVVADLDMPHLDGIALGRAIRARRPATRILTMSGGAHGRPGSSSIHLAPADLTKPFSAEALLRALGQILEDHSRVTDESR